MLTSDYEAMKFHESRSKDLIHEATKDRLVRKVLSSSQNSRPRYTGLIAGLGTMLISWGEKLINMS